MVMAIWMLLSPETRKVKSPGIGRRISLTRRIRIRTTTDCLMDSKSIQGSIRMFPGKTDSTLTWMAWTTSANSRRKRILTTRIPTEMAFSTARKLRLVRIPMIP